MNLTNFRSVAAVLAAIVALGAGCEKTSEPKFDLSKKRDFANALYNQQLYHQSVQEYNDILANYNLDEPEAANINYIIGDIYFERLHDYEDALSYYLKIKHLYPQSTLIEEVNKKMVACLERLARSADAQQVLDEAALIDPSQVRPSRPGEVIARIGKKQFTSGDLEFEINQLPPYMKSQLSDRSRKIDFLKQYIATELLYDSAKRQGLEKDQEVIEATFQAKKNFMVQKLLQQEVSAEVSVQESDAKLYYDANKEKYAKKDDQGKIEEIPPFESIKAQVMQDYIGIKQQEAYKSLIQRLMRAEAVEIFEDKLH